jgi:tetratricopeptide (TPR) repeat protein
MPLKPPLAPDGDDSTSAWESQARRLTAAIEGLPPTPLRQSLTAALVALAAGDLPGAVAHAQTALQGAPTCALAFRLMAMALEGQGELAAALDAYQAAYDLEPYGADILADLGRLAGGLDMPEAAARFFVLAMAGGHHSPALSEQLAQALRLSGRYDEAVEVLRQAILAAPGNALLWNALGAVVLQQGDSETALTFFEQALSLAPGQVEPLYNRASAMFERGDLNAALADCDAALARAPAHLRPSILVARALVRLSLGDLAQGWPDYEARLDPDFAKAPVFDLPQARWRPSDPLAGRRLLVVGEQGLGDELMFAGLIPDLLAALGPQGALSLAVEPRLTALFQRSFPQADVHAHATRLERARPVRTALGDVAGADLWTPLASLAQRFRPDLASFAGGAAPLAPDPARVAHWRAWLATLGDGPKIGVTWKSMKLGGERAKYYAPFGDWLAALSCPGAGFVNLQYGDSDAEQAQARAAGIALWAPPGLDLTHDLDDLAALCAALDLVAGAPNATTNLAGACGAPVWLLAAPVSWPRLGTDRYPWFPQARVFVAERFGDWRGAMARMADALTDVTQA